MFAGTCIGVIALVVALDAFRRLSKEYDALIIRKHFAKSSAATQHSTASVPSSDNGKGSPAPITRYISSAATCQQTFRPSVLQQAVRALLHMVQFAVAYFIMLLAMYYNGYIIICIFIGSNIGAFIFSWQSIGFAG
jgi:copper transporter 1